jgi:hypothetical protein
MSTIEEQELAEAGEPAAGEPDVDADEQADLGDGDQVEPDLEHDLGAGDEPEREIDEEHDDVPEHGHPSGMDPETFAMMEERGKKLDRLGTHVAKKLVEIFGEQEADEFELCELCTWTHTFGWRVPTVPPEQVRDAVKRAIGLGTLDEMRPYSAFATCDTCAGLGNVRTGSQVTAHLYRTCPSCMGRGYSSTIATDADRPAPSAPVAAMQAFEGGPAVEPDVDMFGTPRGHPDYGKLAQHREVPISHWADNLPTGP